MASNFAISAGSTEPLPERAPVLPDVATEWTGERTGPGPGGGLENGSMNDCLNYRQMIEESACKPCGRLPLKHRMSMDTHRWQNNPIPLISRAGFRSRWP
jgi:hypothetical protein